MKNSARFVLCVCILLMAFALAPVARAGGDADRVVVSLSGKAWARSFDRTQRALRYAAWKPLHKGDQIGPESEIRVDKGGALKMQTGATLEDPAAMPTDETLFYDLMSEGSLARLNDQNWAVAHRSPILQTLKGKITHQSVKGRIPAKEYWKKQGVILP